jgi:trehalose 6-phosphate phosphatase
MESIPGAMVENNKFCLSVHFRCVDEEEWDGLGKEVRAVLEGYPDLCLTKGTSNALEFLLESLGELYTPAHKLAPHVHLLTLLLCANNSFESFFLLEGYAGRGDVFPIYIGDDRTDEDAFKVSVALGTHIMLLKMKS